jgi:dimethylargininase
MAKLIAITRDVSPSFVDCQLTHLTREPIDVERARAQHGEYERALERLGCTVTRIPAGADMPDSVFIEDIAIVFDELAVVTRPGAVTRRSEVPDVVTALSPHRPVIHIAAPGTIDGGDVLTVGHSVFVGQTSRTNDAGLDQLRTALAPYGYRVRPATVRGCLHLKSAITALDDRTLLANRRWMAEQEFADFDLVDIDPAEPMGANIVRVGPNLLYAAAFPRTLDLLQRRGYAAEAIDVSEIAKAEGAVTCCSLIFTDRTARTVTPVERTPAELS